MRTIIYIGGFELPDKNAAAQRVIGNAKVLRELGYNVVLVDIDRNTKDKIEETRSGCFGFTRFSIRYTNKRLTNIDDFLTVVNLYKLDEIKVIAYNYPGIALWKIKNYCKKHSIKIYADCTEWYGMLGDNIVKRIIKGADSYIRMNLIQPKLDGMIAISRYLEEFYKEKLPTICIPPLTDLEEKKWKKEEIKSHEEIQIVYAGNPGKHKDKINKIIEALYKTANTRIHLSIVGITKEQFLEYYPEDAKIIEEMKNKVIFGGKVSHEMVIHMLKRADYSMFYREVTRVTMAGFPTKFSEAITCGTPVITNKTSDLDEYLIEGKNGFWITDSIEKTLEEVTSLPIIEMSDNDKSCFDYRRYISIFDKFLNKVGERE